jgi:dihydroxy-acid dehydratase
LLRTGDTIEIDISARKINVLLSDNELLKREKEEIQKGDGAYKPATRNRKISSSLKAYAANVSSADLGAIRLI